MESLISHSQNAIPPKTNTFSTLALIEQGLSYVQQGHYAEGVAIFEQAREQLLPQQEQLATVLEALIAATAQYLQAQLAMLEASKRLVMSESEQQAKIAALKTLLSTAQEHVDGPDLEKNISTHHHLQLLTRSQTSDKNKPENPSFSIKSKNKQEFPPLYIRCFGRFEVRRASPDGEVVQLCPNLKGQALLRYLVSQPERWETMDKLIAVLWSDEAPDVAHHKLRVAISALRRSLNNGITDVSGGGYILCKGQTYELNRAVVVYSDVDEFMALYRSGQQATDEAMVEAYERACRLYIGPFLIEDLYMDWSFIRREELNKMYVAMCNKLAEFSIERGRYENAAMWATTMLKVNRCDEEAHRLLIRAYAAEGRRSEALRQYEHCQRVLFEELGVQPMAETQNIFNTLLNGTFSASSRIFVMREDGHGRS